MKKPANIVDISLIILIGLLLLLNSGCPLKRSGSGTLSGSPTTQYKARTPLGAYLLSPVKIADNAAAMVDRGLTQAFDEAEKLMQIDPSRFRRHSVYTVWLYPRDNRCEQAAFVTDIFAPGWDQTPEDKDPRVGHTLLCIVGTLWLHNAQPGMIVVNDASILETAVRYEAEHNILMEGDLRCFHMTAYHHYHPIFGSNQCETAFGSERYSTKKLDGLRDAVSKLAGAADVALITAHVVR